MKQYWFRRKDVLRAVEYTVVLIWFYLFVLAVPSGPTRQFLFLKINLRWSRSGSFGRDYAWKECGGRTTQYDSRLWFPVSSWANNWSLDSWSECTKKKITPGDVQWVLLDAVKVGFGSAEDWSKQIRFCAAAALVQSHAGTLLLNQSDKWNQRKFSLGLLLIQQGCVQTGDKLRQSTHASIYP